MNRVRKKFVFLGGSSILLLAVCYLLSSAASALSSAGEEIAKIQKAYEHIEDMSGGFVQKSYIRDLRKTETFKGQFFIKRPMKMKWSYGGNNPQDVLINDEEIIIYQKKEKQAFRGKFNRDTYGQAPIALLSGFGKIQEEFSASEKDGKLILKPKGPMGGVTSVEIELSESGFPIKSFVVNDSYSNKIEMTLNDVRINTGLEDKFFKLVLPEGVSIFRQNP